MMFFENEIELKYKKLRGRYIGTTLLLLFFGLIFIVSLGQVIGLLTSDKIEFDAIWSYIMLMFSSAMVAFFTELLQSYIGNKITISDFFIKIRRGALGKTYTIAKSAIIAKQSVCMSIKGRDTCKVIFYLKNGKKISTGDLNCYLEDFNNIDKVFKFKRFSDLKLSKLDKANLKTVELNENDYVTKTNYLFRSLTFVPLILSIVVAILLFSGFNSIGSNDNFLINGTVVNKKAEENKKSIHYEITVQSNTTYYDIDVSKNIYLFCYVNENITIKGNRGRLGIPYNIYFSWGK
ncbi:MAG: hypothetical protein AB6733_24450 [Clostridiaceae bacterium]